MHVQNIPFIIFKLKMTKHLYCFIPTTLKFGRPELYMDNYRIPNVSDYNNNTIDFITRTSVVLIKVRERWKFRFKFLDSSSLNRTTF